MSSGSAKLSGNELIAANVMLDIYGPGWTVDPRDVKGAPAGTHDFDLVSDSATVAVEISTIANTLTMGHPRRWELSFPEGMTSVTGPTRGWILTARADADPRKLKKSLGVWLAELETLGVERSQTAAWQGSYFEPAAGRPREHEILRELARVGVERVEAVPKLPAGEISILRIEGEFTWNVEDREHFSQFVSDELQGTHLSDVKKVVAASADRRAVFFWLHVTSHLDVIRRLDNGLLDGTVYGAEDIDEVWIGRLMVDDSVVAYRWRDSDGWKTFEYGGSAA